MRQAVVYLLKFAKQMRGLDRDSQPLTDEELAELVAVYGELPAARSPSEAASAAAGEQEDDPDALDDPSEEDSEQ